MSPFRSSSSPLPPSVSPVSHRHYRSPTTWLKPPSSGRHFPWPSHHRLCKRRFRPPCSKPSDLFRTCNLCLPNSDLILGRSSSASREGVLLCTLSRGTILLPLHGPHSPCPEGRLAPRLRKSDRVPDLSSSSTFAFRASNASRTRASISSLAAPSHRAPIPCCEGMPSHVIFPFLFADYSLSNFRHTRSISDQSSARPFNPS